MCELIYKINLSSLTPLRSSDRDQAFKAEGYLLQVKKQFCSIL